jgi:hypothetical protein
MLQIKASSLPRRMRTEAGNKISEARDRSESAAAKIPNQRIQRGNAFASRAAIEAAPTNRPKEATWNVPPDKKFR